MKSIFGKFTGGLRKTRESLIGGVQRALTAKSTIDDALLDEVEEILLGGDVGVPTTGVLLERIRQRVKKDKYVSSAELTALLRDEVSRVLGLNGSKSPAWSLEAGTKPFVMMVVGVNGVGKTTTIGKLAAQLRAEGKSVLLGAADTFRAAANEQLEIWAQRAGVELIRQAQGADPASVAFDTVSAAAARNIDVVIIDTAGRLHTKVNLMEELKKIRRVLEKRVPGAPQETLLVLDANTGQNALSQARQFTEATNVTGLVLTKLDGTAKGGVVLAVSHELGIPVRFIGVGEGIDDLQPFDAKVFVDALFEGTPDPGIRP